MWRSIDINGNGYVSLAEMDKGIRDVIKLDAVFDAKPPIIRAFQLAKNAVPAKPGKLASGLNPDDYLEWREFKIFLKALRQRFEYFEAFKAIDQGHDGRISLQEFTAAKPLIEKWVGPIADAKKEFSLIDANGGGQILFDEFCDWSVKKGLDLHEDENF